MKKELFQVFSELEEVSRLEKMAKASNTVVWEAEALLLLINEVKKIHAFMIPVILGTKINSSVAESLMK